MKRVGSRKNKLRGDGDSIIIQEVLPHGQQRNGAVAGGKYGLNERYS